MPHLLGSLLAVVCAVFAGWAQLQGSYPVGWWIALMLVLSALVVTASIRLLAIPNVCTLIGFALLLRIIGIFTPAFFEDDYFRYLWDGYRTLIDGNPYDAAPSAWFGRGDEPDEIENILSQVNYPQVPTIYGPALQHLFAFCAWVQAGALWPWKILLCAADMALVVWLARTFGAQRAMLYAWSPLVVHEIAVAAHPDGLIGALLLAACWFAWQGRLFLTVLCAGTVIAMKIHVAMLLPFLWLIFHHCHQQHPALNGASPITTHRLHAIVLFGGTLLVYATHWLPYAAGFTNAWQSFETFARLWQFNAVGYAAVLAIFPASARVISLTLIVSIVACCLWWLLRVNRNAAIAQDLPNGNTGSLSYFYSAAAAITAAFGALLFFSPVINPWYFLWLLPLACATTHVTAWVAACVALLSYATNHHLGVNAVSVVTREAAFNVPLWATLTQAAAILCAFAWDITRRKSSSLKRSRTRQ